MEEMFFQKEFFFSYSGLNKLLYSPRVWYRHYVLNDREDKTDLHLIEGKVIHALLLDEANFSKNFIVSPMKFPGDSTKILLDKIFQHAREKNCLNCKLDEHKERIIELLKEIDLHQSLTDDKKADKAGVILTGDQKRLDKIITESNINYYEFLKTKEGKDLLDQETFDKCKVAADLLKSDPRIVDLLKLGNTSDKIKVYNEEPLSKIKFDDLPFGLKGIVDNVVVDDVAKIVYINDVKTTGKTIEDFHETVDYYNYWIQAAIYKVLVKALNPNNYPVRFTFIVIDKHQQVYPFLVSDKTMGEWTIKLQELLERAKWHYKNRKFNLPYKFEIETVIL